MNPGPVLREKVVVFTGAGVSAESGLRTFRDSDGLWHEHSIYDVATPEAFARDPALVLGFYNERRRSAAGAEPNAAHTAIAALERGFDVTVVTQNVDDLHERAGSSRVIHLHGRLSEVRSSIDPDDVSDIGAASIAPGDLCGRGSQLRPNIVWFGEEIHHADRAIRATREADRLLVVGTSLTVYPAAGLLCEAWNAREKLIVTLELDEPPADFQWRRGKAAELVPPLVADWLASVPA